MELRPMQQAGIVAYPISLDVIREKVSNGRKRKRPNTLNLLSDYETQNNVKTIVNEFHEKIVRVEGDIPVQLPVKKGDRFLFISYDQTAFTHGLHKYPAKFFPELPRWLIKRYSRENDLILDPFSGSGTVNVEAILIKRNSVGVDVDPFSRFISEVKTTPLPIDELEHAQKKLLNLATKFDFSKVKGKDIPEFPYRDNWFNQEIIFELAYIKKIIKALKINEETKNYFLINMSSIVRAVSNADDNCTRTVIRKKLNKQIFPGDALTKFVERILINTPKMIQFSELAPKRIKTKFPDTSDARSIGFPDQTFDFAVTSPPYVNAVDYPRTHQLESYWLELASGSLTPLKKRHVGTESVILKDYQYRHRIGEKQADKVIGKIYSVDKRRAYIAYKYLLDMRKNFEETYRVLKKGARYAVVVGNNKIRGNLFESWKYLMEIAEQVGFSVETYFGSEIIKHFIKVPRKERINTDWILILKR